MSTTFDDSQSELKGFSRRFAQISVPGITEPKVLQGISIPVGSDNVSTLRKSGLVMANIQERKQQQKLRARARQRQQMLILSEIESV